MASTPEGKVKRQIKKILDKHDCWYYMPVPGGYGAATLDFLCAMNGHAFAIEAKAPGKTATPRQFVCIKKMEEKQVPCFICDGINLEELEAWLLLRFA